MYAIYVIGYTFQTACTKAAQACLTNDPAQRPLFTRFDSSYMLLMGSGIAMYTSSYLVPKYGGFTLPAMTEFSNICYSISNMYSACYNRFMGKG